MLSFVAGIRIPRLELNPPSPRHLSYWTPHLTEIANERWLSSTTPSKWTNLFDRLGNMKIIFVIFLKQFCYLGCSFYPLTIDSVYFVVFFTLRFLAPFFFIETVKISNTCTDTYTHHTHPHYTRKGFPLFPAASAITAAANDISFKSVGLEFWESQRGWISSDFLSSEPASVHTS